MPYQRQPCVRLAILGLERFCAEFPDGLEHPEARPIPRREASHQVILDKRRQRVEDAIWMPIDSRRCSFQLKRCRKDTESSHESLLFGIEQVVAPGDRGA